jgi:hypothetical protein
MMPTLPSLPWMAAALYRRASRSISAQQRFFLRFIACWILKEFDIDRIKAISQANLSYVDKEAPEKLFGAFRPGALHRAARAEDARLATRLYADSLRIARNAHADPAKTKADTAPLPWRGASRTSLACGKPRAEDSL